MRGLAVSECSFLLQISQVLEQKVSEETQPKRLATCCLR